MEIGKLYYKFKISVKLQEYSRALTFLESVSSYIEELTSEDVALLLQLKKGLLKQNSDCLGALEEEKGKVCKFLFKNVLEDYTETLRSVTSNTVESFINCINNIIYKVKDPSSVGVLNLIRAKLFNFISDSCKEEKAKYLQQAYYYYKMAVQIAIKDLEKSDLNRLKIFHSYCKFLCKAMGDSYRSMLFCINVMDELHQMKLAEERSPESLFHSPESEHIEKKLRNFYEENLVEYNKTLRIYHPEYREY